MTIHRYPTSSLLFDGLRALFGAAATLGPCIFLEAAPAVRTVLGLIGLVFVLFGCRVMMQALSSIQVTGQAIAVHGPFAKTLPWRDLSALKLAHYAAPRRGAEGWYQLTLSGAGQVLRLESTLEGFDQVVDSAFDAARSAELSLDPTTSENLKTLGYRGEALT